MYIQISGKNFWISDNTTIGESFHSWIISVNHKTNISRLVYHINYNEQ